MAWGALGKRGGSGVWANRRGWGGWEEGGPEAKDWAKGMEVQKNLPAEYIMQQIPHLNEFWNLMLPHFILGLQTLSLPKTLGKYYFFNLIL